MGIGREARVGFIAFVVWAFVAGAPALAGSDDGRDSREPYQIGVDAYEKRDYAAALKAFQPLSDADDFRAQAYLGTMYEYGLGVKTDIAEAARWYRRAAENASQAFHRQRNDTERWMGMVESKDATIDALQREIRNLRDTLNSIRRQLDPGYGAPVPSDPQ